MKRDNTGSRIRRYRLTIWSCTDQCAWLSASPAYGRWPSLFPWNRCRLLHTAPHLSVTQKRRSGVTEVNSRRAKHFPVKEGNSLPNTFDWNAASFSSIENQSGDIFFPFPCIRIRILLQFLKKQSSGPQYIILLESHQIKGKCHILDWIIDLEITLQLYLYHTQSTNQRNFSGQLDSWRWGYESIALDYVAP